MNKNLKAGLITVGVVAAFLTLILTGIFGYIVIGVVVLAVFVGLWVYIIVPLFKHIKSKL